MSFTKNCVEMVHFKLYYFPCRGRADPIRQLFKLAGVQFDNEAVEMDEWPQMKGKMPMGQMPVLEVDGQQISQSLAILRFLGRQFDRAGKTPLESAKLDMIADYVQEMRNQPDFAQWAYVLYGRIQTDKTAYFKEKVMPIVEQFAPTVEKFLLENGSHLFLGDTETWVDVFVAETFSRVEDFGLKDALSAYPHIQQLIRRIHNVPAIQKYLKERPDYIC